MKADWDTAHYKMQTVHGSSGIDLNILHIQPAF